MKSFFGTLFVGLVILFAAVAVSRVSSPEVQTNHTNNLATSEGWTPTTPSEITEGYLITSPQELMGMSDGTPFAYVDCEDHPTDVMYCDLSNYAGEDFFVEYQLVGESFVMSSWGRVTE